MKSRLFKAIILGFIVGILGLFVSILPFTLGIEENTGLGLLFKLRGERQAPSDVIVVSIDKESSEQLDIPDNPDKWPRSLHARLSEKMAKEGAKVVSFDVHFIEPRVPEDDKLFAESMKKAGNVILTEPLKTKEVKLPGGNEDPTGVHSIVRIVKPIPLFLNSAASTAPFPLPRIPFKVNQYWTFQTGAGDSPTMPVVAFQFFTLSIYEEFVRLLNRVSPTQAEKLPPDRDTIINTRGIKKLTRDLREIFESDPTIANRMLEELEQSGLESTDEKKYRLLKDLIKTYGGASRRYINYYGPPRTITTIPYYQALRMGERAEGDKQIDFKGKAVFVGLSEVLLADRKDSFYTVYSKAGGLFIPGVEIAATAFSNILEDTPVKPVRYRYHMLILLLWGILTGIACRIFKLKIGALCVVGLSILYLIASVILFKATHTWYPVVLPVFLQTPFAFLGAVTIEYGHLFKEKLIKLRMEDDLTSAHEVQMSMLPAECPEIEGYQIAASSTPAREVGGDFFDFFEIPDDKLGLVIGDVTGKSVSGALVMSASRSVFRMLSEEPLTVGEIMIRANKRLKKDITRGMFVALLYAVLDTKDRTVSLCSAGQTQPIHHIAKTGEAPLVESEGDTFPLGILDEADYKDTQLQLNPGDSIIFYTDGIVEAMNEKEEMFGFERFQEIVQGAGEKDADTLLNEIINKVDAFVGAATEQHDDLTIIVLKAESEEQRAEHKELTVNGKQ